MRAWLQRHCALTEITRRAAGILRWRRKWRPLTCDRTACGLVPEKCGHLMNCRSLRAVRLCTDHGGMRLLMGLWAFCHGRAISPGRVGLTVRLCPDVAAERSACTQVRSGAVMSAALESGSSGRGRSGCNICIADHGLRTPYPGPQAHCSGVPVSRREAAEMTGI